MHIGSVNEFMYSSRVQNEIMNMIGRNVPL